jgi:hypothetical protein
MALRSLHWVWLVAALLMAGFAHAQAAPDLYAISVPVSGQNSADLQRAAAQGLRELVVRLTGRSDVENNAALNSAYAGADRYLEQYRYERNATDSAGATPWLAQLRFSAASVNDLLRNAGLFGGAASVVLRVTGIESFDDYAALLNYLSRLAVIKGVSPVQVTNDEVTLQLKMQGSAEQLVQQFAVEKRLTPTADGAPASMPLQYRWAAPRG